MTLYIDLYFIFNYIMDLLVILLCRRILGYRRSLGRAFLSALYGALYAVAVLSLAHPVFLPLHLILGGLMPLIACGFGTPKRFLRLLLYFYGISFFLGGAVTAIFRGIAVFWSVGSRRHLTLALLLLAALVGGILCLFFGNVSHASPGRHALNVTLLWGQRSLRFQGYADTGNLLRDPIENTPVILANASLSRRIFSLCSDKAPPDGSHADDPACYEGLPLRLIPCRTVTGSTVLPALKLTAEIENEPYTVCVALNFKRQSDYCGFDALIPIGIL